MTTINKIRENLTSSLRENKEMLKENSLNVGKHLLNSYYKVLLFNFYTDHRTGVFDINLLSGSINKGLDNSENPTLQQRFLEYGHFENNEIKFSETFCQTKEMSALTNLNYHHEFVPKLQSLTRESEELYWQDQKNIDLYHCFGNWNLYDELVVSENELENYKEKNYQVNTKQWNEYTNQLIRNFFQGYELNENLSSNMNRFLKQIDKNWYFGFEYDAKLINKAKKCGFVEFSYYLNIILINKDYNKRDKSDYIFKQRDDILSLGKLNNPFFEQINPLETCSMRYKWIENAPNNITLLSYLPAEFIKLDSRQYLVRYSKDYSEAMKKYLQYFFSITAFTATGYLEYVEKSVKDCIANLGK
jgi:hypothetical protein